MADPNKHGLRRSDLTAEQRRQIRQQAGFGCLVCGNAVGEYEHIDPEFADATIHDPDKMAFLCIQCHGKVTKGLLSKATVWAAKSNPRALQNGFSFEAFDIGNEPPTIHFGPMSALNCRWAIRVNGRPVFWINPPEANGGPFRLNAELRDAFGNILFSIVDNEWRTRTDNWDVEVKGSRISIRNGPGSIALVVKSDPPNALRVERMDMSVEGYKIYCDGQNFTVSHPTVGMISAQSLACVGCEAAVEVKEGSIAFGSGGGSVSFSGTMNSRGPLTSVTLEPKRKIGRNELCPCGSMRKYKKCCGRYSY